MQTTDYLYGSHLPLLIKYVLKTDGPILEVGGGMFSTPFLQQFANHRVLVTMEPNLGWAPKNINDYSLHYWERTIEDVLSYKQDWSVVLIDGPRGRREAMQLLADKCDYMIVHDTNDPNYNYPMELFKYTHTEKDPFPWTTVCSNRKKLP